MNINGTVTKRFGMAFATLPTGTFVMGGDSVIEQADENESPKHRVTFERPFAVGMYAVTQAQWQEVMGGNPSRFIGNDHPVEMVSHGDACEFIARLNQRENTTAYALPTEAQWEYAARAGSQSTYCFGHDRSRLAEFAWYKKNSADATHPVGQLSPNDWGLFDMHGNVHEWCSDWFDRNYYAKAPSKDPAGPDKGLAKALRGGDWGSEDWYCRCAIRSLGSPDRRSPRVGFRVVMSVDED
ncbi:MAG: formylglycine-generating enzyme family protein [Pseudomonadota bacterium]